MRRFKPGDLVRIVTTAEYRAKGGNCTNDCAIACYANSICVVERECIPGYRLFPEKVVMNFQPKDHHLIQNINEYSWQEISLEPVSECDAIPAADNGFEEIF